MKKLALRRLGAMALLGLSVMWPGTARAWDPSTTHMSMTERAVLDSSMHVRWMEASLLQRGLFSPLRLDPAQLDDATLRDVRVALRNAHAASGAQALGGPGACPGASAPASTRAHCVDGDLWEMTAMGWMQLGVIVETMPTARLLHHFVDRQDPSALRWADDDLPRAVLRSKHARAGGALASRATGGGFEGSGRSALSWLEDRSDRWAPPALAHHLQQASLAATPRERDHHLALALLCTGALLHVVQDLSVPAHARGDVSAMFLPLSDNPNDRGLPLQELARDTYGRTTLPTAVRLGPRPAAPANGTLRAPTLRGHLLGHGDFVGLVHEAGRRFFSESSLPAARRIDPGLDSAAAAAALLEGVALDASERQDARLSSWPSDRGYLIGGSGRPLAAYRVDQDDQVQLWLDRRVYRVQMQQLIPAGVDVARSVVDLVHAAWPPVQIDADAGVVAITPGSTWKDATLAVLVEDGSGRRETVARVGLQGETEHRVVDAWPKTVPEGSRVVLVLMHEDGRLPATIERIVDPATPAPASETQPSVPRPRARPPTTRQRSGPPRGSVPPTTAVDPSPAGDDDPAAVPDDGAADDPAKAASDQDAATDTPATPSGEPPAAAAEPVTDDDEP